MDKIFLEFLETEIARLSAHGDKYPYPQIIEMIKHFSKRAESVNAGRNRLTFMFKHYVVKVPRNVYGIGDNEHESCMGKYAKRNRNGRSIPVARTRLLTNGPLYVVAMERVNHASYEEIIERLGSYPYWVDSVDCQQVGFTRSGELVAYDYGYN